MDEDTASVIMIGILVFGFLALKVLKKKGLA